MKIIIKITAFVFATWSAYAQDYNYSTNLYWSITSPVWWYAGTNGTDAGDRVQIIANKVNGDVNLLWKKSTASLTTNGATVNGLTPISTNVAPGFFWGNLQTGVYLSNSWNLVTITNGMNPGDIVTVNSNGQTLIDVWMSNSTPILKPHW
jgi:hypothetical protein